MNEEKVLREFSPESQLGKREENNEGRDNE